MKSETAANAVRAMNKDIKITAHINRVGPETENIYDENFFEELDGVANALDNNDARIYMDKRISKYRRLLIDAGTKGTKGNVQVVVPFLTETYSESAVTKDEEFALCTLKSFPSKIQHTLQWARDAFEGFFAKKTEAAEAYLRDPERFIEQVSEMYGKEPLEMLESLQVSQFLKLSSIDLIS